MAEIQFDEEERYQRPVQEIQKPFFVRLVLSTKIASNDEEANQVLLACIVFLFFLIVIGLWRVFSSYNAVLAPALPNQLPQHYPASYYQPGGATVPQGH